MSRPIIIPTNRAADARDAGMRSCPGIFLNGEGPPICGDALNALKQPFLESQSSNLTPTPSDTHASALRTASVNSLTEEDKEAWNKTQIGYVFVLGTLVTLVFVLRPLLPVAYRRMILLAIAGVWGIGSIGLLYSLYGTSRWERQCSRCVVWLIFTFFSVLVIYTFYLLAMKKDDSTAPATDREEFWWGINFLVVGVFVIAGALLAWIRGCFVWDRDLQPNT